MGFSLPAHRCCLAIQRALARPLRGLVYGVVLLGVVAAAPAVDLRRASIYDVLQLPPGQALRRAIAAQDAGYARRAEALFAGLATRHPVIADHADLLRMRLLVETRRYDDAIVAGGQWRVADSPLEADFYALLGNALAVSGREAEARTAWRKAIDLTDDDDRRASLHASIGESLEETQDIAAATEEYLLVYSSYPLSASAVAVDERLTAFEHRLGQRLRTASHQRKRGDALFRKRRNEEALEAFDAALASGDLSGANERRALRMRADTLFRLRRYSEASEAYALVSKEPDVRIKRARAIARAGEVVRGAKELEAIGVTERGASGARASFLAGLLFEGEGEEEHAHELFRRVMRTGSATQAAAALWRLGWAAYRDGRYDEAHSIFEQLIKGEPDPLSALRARYWNARALEKSGNAASASSIFSQLAQDYPLSYYGWRSRSRAESSQDSGRSVTFGRNTSRLSSTDFERARILLEARLESEARDELNRLFVRARSLHDRVELAHLYADSGEYHRPQRLMVDAYTEHLARGPDPASIEVWWHAWPLPFRSAVRGAADAGGPESGLVYAIMREESGYRPEVVSVSGARGLLQLMPTTAERVARSVPVDPFEVEDLFHPDVNIQLGAAYLAELLARFDGRASAAIASYNAGPHAVSRWLELSPGEDDEWVEAIPYDQTRGYVKRVLRSLHVYRVLY